MIARICRSEFNITAAFKTSSAYEKFTFLAKCKPFSVSRTVRFFVRIYAFNTPSDLSQYILGAALHKQALSAFFIGISHLFHRKSDDRAGRDLRLKAILCQSEIGKLLKLHILRSIECVVIVHLACEYLSLN